LPVLPELIIIPVFDKPAERENFSFIYCRSGKAGSFSGFFLFEINLFYAVRKYAPDSEEYRIFVYPNADNNGGGILYVADSVERLGGGRLWNL